MTDFDERRIDQRIEHSGEATLKIVFVSENPTLLGKVLTGTMLDISASGLRLALQSPLVLDSTIDVRVTLSGSTREYYVSGKVRWCKKVEENLYHAGVVLQDLVTMHSDYKEWRKMLKSM